MAISTPSVAEPSVEAVLLEAEDEFAQEGSVNTASKHATKFALEPTLAPLRLVTPGSSAHDVFFPATPEHAVGTKAVARAKVTLLSGVEPGAARSRKAVLAAAAEAATPPAAAGSRCPPRRSSAPLTAACEGAHWPRVFCHVKPMSAMGGGGGGGARAAEALAAAALKSAATPLLSAAPGSLAAAG